MTEERRGGDHCFPHKDFMRPVMIISLTRLPPLRSSRKKGPQKTDLNPLLSRKEETNTSGFASLISEYLAYRRYKEVVHLYDSTFLLFEKVISLLVSVLYFFVPGVVREWN